MATINLEALRAFQAVAQAGSFTKAATELGLDKSKVSRDIRALEGSLGVVLLTRSTRAVRLTLAGETLFQRVTPLLSGIEEAVAAVPDRVTVPTGEVTLATTPDIGREVVARALVAFRGRYPAVRVRLLLTNEVVDILAEGTDLALRVGRPGGDDLVARKVGQLVAGFFAAPAYLKRRGNPGREEELAGHDGLWPTPPRKQRSFAPKHSPPPPVVECSDFGVIAEVARAGGGIALLPTFLAGRDVASGALVRVLPGVSLQNAPVFVVNRRQKPLPPRVAALRSFLLEARLFG